MKAPGTGTPWLSVLTTPRRPEYLQRTLDELDAAGAGVLGAAGRLVRWIAVDGDPDDVPARDGWLKGSVGDGQQGARRSMLRVLQAAADASAAHLLYFEDDVLACHNAVIGLHHCPVPAAHGFLVACDVRGLAGWGNDLRPQLVSVGDDHEFWGSCALKLPWQSLEHLIAAEVPAGDPKHAGDLWLQGALASHDSPCHRFAVLAPSLFQHVGERSAVGPWGLGDRDRQASNFSRSVDGLVVADAFPTLTLVEV